MSKRSNFLRWLRQWKPPAEVEKAAVVKDSPSEAPADHTRKDSILCPWCCEMRTAEYWQSLNAAWQLHRKDDDGYYLACTECREYERVWAVGSSGQPYYFGYLEETCPRIEDSYGIMLDAVAEGQLLGYNKELGDQ